MADIADVQQDFCEDLPWTESCVEERRHLEARADRRRIEVAVEHSARQQAAAVREASGASLPGDGIYAGQGWWCFHGEAGEARFGRCVRSLDGCVERLRTASGSGLRPDEHQCDQQRQAACFQLTRSLEQGARPFCFPTVPLCDRYRGVAEAKDYGEVTDCRPYE